jgi:Na+/H+ antiporter NhaD/arsenite permease-like protein
MLGFSFLASVSGAVPDPPVWLMAPFVLLLGAIALMPFINLKWWHHHYPKVAVGLGLVVAAYYLFVLRAPQRMLDAGHEYICFIALVGSLFIVVGGIHLRVKGKATAAFNVLYLFLGAILANFIGTTGASILMIRPFIRMNRSRISAYHVVFFIFVISNVGGGLTPIGDPPLFLGYLKGVPFFWILQHCWTAWAVCIGALLAIFYLIDRRQHARAPASPPAEDSAADEWRFDGRVNLIFLAVIIASVFVAKPHFLREGIMVLAVAGSLFFTAREIRAANHFDYEPLREVAWLFVGIFLTMVPALDYLTLHAKSLGLNSEMKFFWLTGLLSGALDNAPTYLTFLAAAMGNLDLNVENPADVAQFIVAQGHFLTAISLGAVFFGAMTYIGNAPNFMVKSIAESMDVKVPAFLPYVFKYSLPILLPVFAIISLIFFYFHWL